MIKAVATDIDGTFIRTQPRDYDRALFATVYQTMVAQGVRLIVASGDQYYFLRSLFPEVGDQLAYVAENGALTIDRNQEVDCVEIAPADVAAIITYLDQLPDVNYVICGRKSAYVKRRFSDQFIQSAHRFYQRLAVVNHLAEIDDIIFKFALVVPKKKTREIAQCIDQRFNGIIRATASGYGAIDLIVPGMDKAHGLRLLLERWGLSADDLIAFGDGENDLEMFGLARVSYAMGNAPTNVQAAAIHVIGTNDEQAELHELARLFLERGNN